MRMGIQTVRPLALSAIMFIVLLTGGVWSPRAATAATYYVSTGGSNSNSCSTSQTCTSQTCSTAKRNVNSALPCLTAGDTLYIRAGTYTEYIGGNSDPIP